MSARNGLFTGILIGGLVGAGVALLTAPRSGEETRDILREKGDELKAKATTTLDTGRSRVIEIKDRGQAMIAEKKEEMKAAFQEVKSRLRASAAELEAVAEDDHLIEAT